VARLCNMTSPTRTKRKITAATSCIFYHPSIAESGKVAGHRVAVRHRQSSSRAGRAKAAVTASAKEARHLRRAPSLGRNAVPRRRSQPKAIRVLDVCRDSHSGIAKPPERAWQITGSMMGCEAERHNSRQQPCRAWLAPERWRGDPCRDHFANEKANVPIVVGATGSVCRESGGYTTPARERPSRIVSGDVVTLPVPACCWRPGRHKPTIQRLPMTIERPMFPPRAESVD
jgi:hypothetical protein